MNETSDQEPVPTPPAEAEVKLAIGVDHQTRQVVLGIDLLGHPSGPIKARFNYTPEEAAHLVKTLIESIALLRPKTSPIVTPLNGRGKLVPFRHPAKS